MGTLWMPQDPPINLLHGNIEIMKTRDWQAQHTVSLGFFFFFNSIVHCFINWHENRFVLETTVPCINNGIKEKE